MHKKILLFLLVLSTSLVTTAQEASSGNSKTSIGEPRCPVVFIGTGTGLENPFGLLGINIDVPVIPYFSVNAGVGISSWGTKMHGEVRYYLKPCNKGWAFSAGITHNTGLDNFTISMPTVAGTADVTMDLLAATNVYIGIYHFWRLGKRGNRFNITTGYSIPLSSNNYIQTAGPAIDEDGRSVMKIVAPGGLMLGVGFSFGIYSK